MTTAMDSANTAIRAMHDETVDLRFALRSLVERITADDLPSFHHHNDADMAALRRAIALLEK